MKYTINKMLNKKGITARIIMVMVLVLVIGIILIIFTQKWYETASYEVHKRQCEQSVTLHLASQKIGEPSEIKCPAWFETLSGDDEKIKGRIADLMADAWSVYGKGRYELFEEEAVYCTIYAVVDFSEKNKKIDGLSDYLVDTKIPFKGISYAEYLGGYESPEAKKQVPNLENIKKESDYTKYTIDTSNDYAVIFVYAKGMSFIDNTIKKIGEIKASIGAGIIGGAAGGIVAVFVFGTNPVGWTTAGAIALTGGILTAASTYFKEKEVGWYSAALFRPYEKEEIEKLGCQEFPVKTVK